MIVCSVATAQPCTGVLYGASAMTLTTSATDTTETGSVWIWTLTEAIVPTGIQTITLQGCTADAKYASCATVAAATTQTKVNASSTLSTQATANPAITVTTTAATTGYSGFHSGAAAPVAAGTGNTLLFSMDYGAKMSQTHRRTSDAEAAGSIVHQTAAIAADDWCAAAVNLAEFTPPVVFPPFVTARGRS